MKQLLLLSSLLLSACSSIMEDPNLIPLGEEIVEDVTKDVVKHYTGIGMNFSPSSK